MHKTKPNSFFAKIFSFMLIASLLFSGELFSQKIGVVLSGGGAGGLAHVGVLKALEENNIPIDYITGTSVGALVGGLYAAGYSPDEIEKLVTSQKFIDFTKGNLEEKYRYHFKKNAENASWFSYRFGFDSVFVTNIPTNLINSVPIDFYMMELFSPSCTVAKNDFDSLFVPFRCVASDIEDKKSVVFKNGDLSIAIRSSMTYPFYLRPISVDGKLLFDGGLYNNFPSNIMMEDFNPDFIIGSVVTGNTPNPNDDNLYLQLRNMLMSKTNYNPSCENGLLLYPWSNVGIFSFDQSQRLIDSGYVSVIRNLPTIREHITSREAISTIAEKRNKYRACVAPVVFTDVEIKGVNRKQAEYIRKSLFKKNKPLTLEQLKKRYFRLAEDDKIKSIFPVAKFDSLTGKYVLEVRAKKEKEMVLELGGNFSNRPISDAFIGLQYNYLGKRAFTIYSNAYLGKLNTSVLGKTRVDFPGKTPFYIEATGIYNKWDYFKSSTLFYNVLRPAFLIQEDGLGEACFGIPFGNRAKITAGGGVANMGSVYYQTDNFSDKDTADRTDFQFAFGRAEYELNTLNRKLYASEGLYVNVRAKYYNGYEFYRPGTTSNDSITSDIGHQWFQLNGKIDYYLKTSKLLKIGFLGEGVISSQDFFKNYTSSILSAPAFMPTPESRTLFLEKFRAQKYIAGGVKLIINPVRNLDIRFEGYVFQPVQSILKDQFNNAEYSAEFLYRYFSGMAALVYHTPIGPISTSINYYHGEKQPFSFLFHFGYTIFNKRASD